MKFSIKDFFSKCDQILRIWSHLLKKSLTENFIFCVLSKGQTSLRPERLQIPLMVTVVEGCFAIANQKEKLFFSIIISF